MIDNLLIVNKSGGLIYFSKLLQNENYMMVLGSTIQSLNQISSSVMKTETSFSFVEYQNKSIGTFRTLTGISFIFICDKVDLKSLKTVFFRIYRDYANIVLADPFYTIEMPIQNKGFDPTRYF